LKKHPELPARQASGFTLIELMIVVAIIGILAAVALPSYVDYLRRGKIVDATNTLSALRAKMEQYYQDNRKYSATDSASPCGSTIANVGSFKFACSGVDADSYTITATGMDSMSEFAYTIDEKGGMETTALPSSWGTAGSDCWITRKGGTC